MFDDPPPSSALNLRTAIPLSPAAPALIRSFACYPMRCDDGLSTDKIYSFTPTNGAGGEMGRGKQSALLKAESDSPVSQDRHLGGRPLAHALAQLSQEGERERRADTRSFG